MAATDEDALFCDLWQYYGVQDYKALPLNTAARLFCGLPHDSRCGRRLSGANVDGETILLASILDRVSWLVWAQTADGKKGRNRPKPIADRLLGKEETSSPCRAFRSGAEFEKALEKLRKGE